MEDYRKSLYKESKHVLTTQQHSRRNRQLQEANRNKQRTEQFQLSRQISISPTPRKRLPQAQTDKENAGENEQPVPENAVNISRTNAKVVCTARDPEKIKKQEAFILRFLDWKDRKREMLEKKKTEVNKKKPFVSAVSKDSGFVGKTIGLAAAGKNEQTTTFVPKDHKHFQPPSGLRSPEEIAKDKIKGRQSIYTAVPTPPRKARGANESVIKKNPLTRNINLHTKIVNNNFINKTPARTEIANGAIKSSANGPKAKITPSAKTAVNAPNNIVKTLSNKSSTKVTTTKAAATTATSIKPRSLKMPPPPLPVKKPVGDHNIKLRKKPEIPEIKITKTAAKFKTAATTRLGSSKPAQRLNAKKSPQQPQKNSRLTQTMKAKKPIKPNTGASSKLLSLMITQSNGAVADMVMQTPKDFSNSSHFDEFVTSTKTKNSSQSVEEVDGISPIEMLSKRTSSGTSAAKRNLLKVPLAKTTQQQQDLVEANDCQKLPTAENVVRKFNFIRYSEINTTVNDEDDDLKKIEETQDIVDNEVDTTLVTETCVPEEKTPIKNPNSEEKPVNYLSPFVSVSRGKVSLKKEKEKRNSVYLANPLENELNNSLNNKTENTATAETIKSPQYSAESRRTLEAVRYFRKQLQDEIERLHQQCDVWEDYKLSNLEKLQAANCDDMIDVTVGQTRLLTSKKFMQFKSLIGRCEAAATGIGLVPYDGSEATRVITAVDLEGFWSMLGLQVENLAKRFDNLERWKVNDWQDPEEIKTRAKPKPKNLTKVKKAAAPTSKPKPNSALQQMLRNMRNKKANNAAITTTDDIILTPSKVKDRKYFSPAATVVAIPASNRRLSLMLQAQESPNRRTSLNERKDSPSRKTLRRKSNESPIHTPKQRLAFLARKNSQDSPSLLKSVLQFSEVLSNMELSMQQQETSCGAKKKSLNEISCPVTPRKNEMETFNSPMMNGRKSILKTPGTAKSKLKNVVFNEKLRVKKFNFMENDMDDPEDCNQSNEEDMPQTHDFDEETPGRRGTYSLRNRKIRLRPSCEIVIPK